MNAVNPKQRGLAFAPSIQDRFESFLQANPEFYPEFVRRARELRRMGFRTFSADAVCHAIRYDRAIQTQGDTYKINNSWTSRISRLVEERESDLKGFFEQRGLRAA